MAAGTFRRSLKRSKSNRSSSGTASSHKPESLPTASSTTGDLALSIDGDVAAPPDSIVAHPSPQGVREDTATPMDQVAVQIDGAEDQTNSPPATPTADANKSSVLSRVFQHHPPSDEIRPVDAADNDAGSALAAEDVNWPKDITIDVAPEPTLQIH